MSLKDGQGFARRINLKNLQRFAPLLARKSKGESSVAGDDEQSPRKITSTTKNDSKAGDPDIAEAEKFFAGKRFKSRVRFTAPGKSRSKVRAASKRRSRSTGIPSTKRGVASASPDRGMLVWQKILSKTDAQRQNGHRTGDIRLTQAKNENPRQIDQTTYFRNEVFGKAKWHRKNAEVKEATVAFYVNILGIDYGRHNLVVSHKPSGEAKQGNYSTGIRWGDLMPITKQTDLTGRTLRLFDPPADETAFVLEIV